MLIGAYQPNSPGSTGQVTAFGKAAGFVPRITSYYTSSFSQPFPVSFAQQMAAQGTRVLVQWQPRGTTNAAIASGQQDQAIRAAADAIKQVNSQVIVSYGQEMNGNWYDWGSGGSKPADYIAAWRHIWTVFQQQGVRNVTWLWDPNISYEGSPPLKSWYPGDQYVTWVGLDGYYQQSSSTFESVFSPSIGEIRSFTGKPLVIGETGVSGPTGPAQIAEFFAGASLAGGSAVVYFDEAQTGDSTHQDWRLENNPANMAAFKAAVQLYAERPL
jgi:mannan endo-1,4-beta-mannosidase